MRREPHPLLILPTLVLQALAVVRTLAGVGRIPPRVVRRLSPSLGHSRGERLGRHRHTGLRAGLHVSLQMVS